MRINQKAHLLIMGKMKESKNNYAQLTVSRNAGSFRRLAFTKPAPTPALRLSPERFGQALRLQ
jgi:hypothetical protein